MTRRRIQIKKVDNTTARQVTFSKRRRGLFKKAFELSTLCDAEIGLMVFSAAGKLFEYASSRFQSLSHTSFYFLFFLTREKPFCLCPFLDRFVHAFTMILWFLRCVCVRVRDPTAQNKDPLLNKPNKWFKKYYYVALKKEKII